MHKVSYVESNENVCLERGLHTQTKKIIISILYTVAGIKHVCKPPDGTLIIFILLSVCYSVKQV